MPMMPFSASKDQSRNKLPQSQPDTSVRDRSLVERSLTDVSGCDFLPQEKPDVIARLFLIALEFALDKEIRGREREFELVLARKKAHPKSSGNQFRGRAKTDTPVDSATGAFCRVQARELGFVNACLPFVEIHRAGGISHPLHGILCRSLVS